MPGTRRQPSRPPVREAERRVRRLFRQYQTASDDRRAALRELVKDEIQELRVLRAESARDERKRRERLGGWFSSLSKGVKALVAAVVAAGAVATAIGAILALWPDPPTPFAELRADLTELSVDEGVTLDEYRLRQEELDGSSAPTRAERRQLASSSAQPPTVGTTTTESTETGETETQTETTTTETTETETTETETAKTETTQTDTEPTDTSDDGGDIIVAPSLSEEAQTRLSDAIRERFGGPSGVPRPLIAEVCLAGPHEPACGLSSTVQFMHVADDADPAEVAERLVEVLSDTRTERREAVGVTVNYRISMTGFRNRRVDVRWELHRPTGPPLPHAWLRNQRAALLQGEADRDSASPHFWVPLPKEAGPFFVRLNAVNENGVTLASARTPEFQ
jgi:hypothetical protein